MGPSGVDRASRAPVPAFGGLRGPAWAVLVALSVFGFAGLWWRAQPKGSASAAAGGPAKAMPDGGSANPRERDLTLAAQSLPPIDSPRAVDAGGARRPAEPEFERVAMTLGIRPPLAAQAHILGAFRSRLDDLSDGTSREFAQREDTVATLTVGHSYRWTSLEPAFDVPERTFVASNPGQGAVALLEVRALGPWRLRAIDARSRAPLERVDLRWEVRGPFDSMEYRGEVGRATLATADGRLALAAAGFLARQSRVVVRAEGYREVATPWIDCDGRVEIDWGDVELRRDAEDVAPTLRGEVLDSTGRGLSGLRIAGLAPHLDVADLRVVGGELWSSTRHWGPTALPFVESGPGGEFELPWPVDGASPALDEGSIASARPAVWGRGHALRVFATHLPGETARLVMPRGATLRGRVRAALGTNAPTGDCQVRVDVAGTVHALELDSDLRFELGGLPAGPARVALSVLELQVGGERVVAEAFATSVALVDGQAVDVELPWGLAADERCLHGRLQLPSGVAYASLRAALEVIGEDAPSRFCSVAADGTFRLQDVPFERCRLFVGGQDVTGSRGFAAVFPLDARAALPASLDLELPAGRVVGLVRRAGLPLAGRAIVAEVVAGEPGNARFDLDYARALAEGVDLVSDAQGRFEVLGLRAGIHRFGAGGTHRVDCDVPAAGVVEVVLEIE